MRTALEGNCVGRSVSYVLVSPGGLAKQKSVAELAEGNGKRWIAEDLLGGDLGARRRVLACVGDGLGEEGRNGRGAGAGRDGLSCYGIAAGQLGEGSGDNLMVWKDVVVGNKKKLRFTRAGERVSSALGDQSNGESLTSLTSGVLRQSPSFERSYNLRTLHSSMTPESLVCEGRSVGRTEGRWERERTRDQLAEED